MATVKINVQHINPFVDAVHELFDTMLGVAAKRGNPRRLPKDAKPQEVVGMIGISGSARGVVAAGFPKDTSIRVVGKLLCCELTEFDDIVSDGIAEVVNMIAGNAKAKLAENHEAPLDLSLPTVLSGSDFRIESPADCIWIEVPFTSALGEFELRLMFEAE